MRQLWKASREDNRGPSSVLGNYKKMLQAQEHNSNYVNEDNSMHHINTDHHKQDVSYRLTTLYSKVIHWRVVPTWQANEHTLPVTSL